MVIGRLVLSLCLWCFRCVRVVVKVFVMVLPWCFSGKILSGLGSDECFQ